jgi:hypothetical protein
MTTKTIPAYLEDERQKHDDDQLRIEQEAARILPLHHGHHRHSQQPKLELQPPVKAAAKTAATKTRKTATGAQTGAKRKTKTKTKIKTSAKTKAQTKLQPRAVRKTATKVRKRA